MMNKDNLGENFSDIQTSFEHEDNSELTLLVHAETVEIAKEMVKTGQTLVQLKTHIDQHHVQIPLQQSKVKVDVIAVNQYIDTIPEVEKHNNVTTIPVFEERAVLVKKIYLKEVIQITEEITETVHEEQVELRRQEPHISFKKFNQQQ